MTLKIELYEVGIDYKGNLNDSQFYENVLPKIHRSQNEKYWIDTSSVKLQFVEFIDRGNYGALALCKRESQKDGSSWVFAKIPLHPVKSGESLLWEACIQILVRKTLARHGFSNGAPRVRDIFELQDGSVGFTMDIIMGAEALDLKLHAASEEQFPVLVLEGIVQIASMISILQKELGFNHRDLRASNLLCRKIESGPRNLIVWDENVVLNKKNEKYRKYEITIQPTMEYTLIDFGFVCFGKSCVRCTPLFSLDKSAYTLDDICPKPGRDMFLFLAFLLAEFNKKIDINMRKLLKKWLDPGYNIVLPISVAKEGKGLYKFIRRYGVLSDKWIYFISGNKKIPMFSSTNASKILMDLRPTK